MWFAFDRRLPGGGRPADMFLHRDPLLTRGERLYLERVGDTALRLYEVVDLSPGVSLTLREVERGSHRSLEPAQGLLRMRDPQPLLAVQHGWSGGDVVQTEAIRGLQRIDLGLTCGSSRNEKPHADCDGQKCAEVCI